LTRRFEGANVRVAVLVPCRDEAATVAQVVAGFKAAMPDGPVLSASSLRVSRRRRSEEPMKPDYDFSKARRGAVVPAAAGKTRITIRLDADIVDWFKAQVNEAGGGNYQSLINEALKSHIQQHGLERTLRKLIREELRRVA